MTLVASRAAFEKAVTDAVAASDATVQMVYDNVRFTTPGKTKKYVLMSVSYVQSTIQTHGAASDFYIGTVQCNIYVPKNNGPAELAAIGEAIIDGLTSVNASGYADPFSCAPKVLEISGPAPLELENRAHFIGLVSCQFTANA
tara:strand:+ start:538 stop:966 length:429 start_codon:yes stop_codon:yes gene_type:complete